MSGLRIWALRQAHHLPDQFTRLRARGLLTLDEIAAAVGVTGHTVLKWRRAGLLVGHVYNDRGECLFEPPGSDAPRHRAWKCRGLRQGARQAAETQS